MANKRQHTKELSMTVTLLLYMQCGDLGVTVPITGNNRCQAAVAYAITILQFASSCLTMIPRVASDFILNLQSLATLRCNLWDRHRWG